jgi:DeoR family fructose operon transcriptional repressor
MTLTGTASTEERRAKLQAMLAQNGRVDLAAAAQEFDVHPMTVRRDLEALEADGVARRVRGGAIHVGAEDYRQRQIRNLSAKRRIAEKLVPLVHANEAIGLDASTTMLQLAAALPDVGRLSVVTNGLATFQALQQRPGVHSYLTGGEAEEQNAALVGPFAVSALGNFLLSSCFVSAACVDPVIGMSDSTIAEVEVKRAMVATAQKVVLGVDSSKLGTRSVARGLPLSAVDLLVTELDPADARLDPFRELVTIL